MTRIREITGRARFDPRMVTIGILVLVLAGLGGFALAGWTAAKADRLVTPVSDLCRQSDATAVHLTLAGACEAADQARQVGPYKVTTAVAEPGRDGVDGLDGIAGQPGTPGAPGQDAAPAPTPAPEATPGRDGEAGTDGEPGESPPCLSEPTQCRGADGRDGIDGTDGQDGRDGRDGAAAASQTYALPDGRVFTCARTGGTDLDPLYRCQETGVQVTAPAEPTQ